MFLLCFRSMASDTHSLTGCFLKTELRKTDSLILVMGVEYRTAHDSKRVLFIQWKILVGISGHFLFKMNFQKETFTLQGTYQTFRNFFLGISIPFNFPPRISVIFVWIVPLLEIEQFLDFPQPFPRNLHHLPPFQSFWNFWSNRKHLSHFVFLAYVHTPL